MSNLKSLLQPVALPGQNDREKKEFLTQLETLRNLYSATAEFLEPVLLGEQINESADAIVFVQLIGTAFGVKNELNKLKLPVIVLTSEFGTVEMWDWEIVSFLREETDLTVFSPYRTDLAEIIMRALAAKKNMQKGMRFLMFQDSPGEGMQSGIFKRFYWWENDCTEQIESNFGLKIIYRSYKELNVNAQKISDERADKESADWNVPCEGLSTEQYRKAVKIYLAVKDEIKELGEIHGVGANCLNESFNSETTPCLAWNMLFERDNILWVCEGDTVTLVSKFIIYSALKLPLMMTNIYPFLVGMAALKHEKIETFPDVPNSDDCALGVHCGYYGFAPQSFCSKWTLKPKVLGIVEPDSVMVDCEFEPGPITLAKIHPNMKKMIIIEADIETYAQYPGSDCRNGALIRFRSNGHKVMQTLCSHHAIIVRSNCTAQLLLLAEIYGFETEVL